jgi:hypothetical protein
MNISNMYLEMMNFFEIGKQEQCGTSKKNRNVDLELAWHPNTF